MKKNTEAATGKIQLTNVEPIYYWMVKTGYRNR